MADESAGPGGRKPQTGRGAKKPPADLEVKISEVHDAVKGLHERLDAVEAQRVACTPCQACFECSCGPCAECWTCRPTVCRPTVCRPTVCRPTICQKCFECSCGPCAE